jgi:hypothetical protein
VHAKFGEGFSLLLLTRILPGKDGRCAQGIIAEKSWKNRKRIVETFGECRPWYSMGRALYHLAVADALQHHFCCPYSCLEFLGPALCLKPGDELVVRLGRSGVVVADVVPGGCLSDQTYILLEKKSLYISQIFVTSDRRRQAIY